MLSDFVIFKRENKPLEYVSAQQQYINPHRWRSREF